MLIAFILYELLSSFLTELLIDCLGLVYRPLWLSGEDWRLHLPDLRE
jgi:hypothetical protein